MRYEHVIKRPNGIRVKICVMVFVGSGKTDYKTSVAWAEKDKRTWTDATEDNRDFRKLTSTEQEKVDLENQLALVSEAELLEAKIGAWNKIKPS